MNKAETAVSLMKQGFSCAPAVLAAFSEGLGLERETAPKLATGFGGGMDRLGETCGAVTGAFMLLGLKYGRTQAEDRAATERTYQMVNDLARERRVFASICLNFVRTAAEIAEGMLNERAFLIDILNAGQSRGFR